MAERGVTREEVVLALDEPEYTYTSGRDPSVRIACRKNLKIPHNPDTGDVLSVIDKDQHEEQPMSGWINLDAKAAVKLFTDWGFEVAQDKGKVQLWHHTLERETLIPLTAPGSGRANGRSSYNKGAKVVGVTLQAFLKGPTDDFRARLSIVHQLDDALDAASGPDPLGIQQKVAVQRATELNQTYTALKKGEISPSAVLPPAPPTSEPPVPTYTPVEEKVLAALLEATAPVPANEIASQLGIHRTSARDALRKAVREGDAYVVGSRPGRSGPPADLFWYAPAPETTPPTPEEEPMSTVINLTASEPAEAVDPDPTSTGKIFTETGTPWPTGGLLIQDEDGVFYVARKLVEEGR